MVSDGRIRGLARGALRRCPRCGSNRIFAGWFTIHDDCPDCGMRYERDPGYWLGAMIINTAVTIGTFLVALVGTAVVTWPDVPWTPLLAVTVAANIIVPLVFYPWSKTVFVALDLAVRPLSTSERSEAEARVSAAGGGGSA